MTHLSHENHIFQMDKKNNPVLTVPSGTRLQVDTLDCFSNSLKTEEDLIGAIDFERVNPATGPIYIEEAQPGDTLKVTIHEISIADQAVSVSLPGMGIFSDQLEEERTVVLPIQDNTISFRGITYPLRKMIGVIGTAPKDQPVVTGTPDLHGGNMDSTQITEGHTLYLPIEVPGALLALGDLHAAMGDGEINGAGAEVAGSVTLTVEVLSDFPETTPMVESDDRWITIASHEDMYEASHMATNQMADFIQYHQPDLSFEEIAVFLSVFGDLAVNQVVNAKKSMRMEIDKRIIREEIKK